LLKLARHPRDQNLLDRLIIVAIIEARSCERFCLLANALPDSELRDFYREFATAEGRHFQLFVNEAKKLFPENIVEERLQQLLVTEANIIEKLPIKPTVH
jgi:tRNA-(ms[2]io[6]A)-hydroxylase